MIEIEASIRSRLLTMTAVTDIVGSGTSARIRPDKLWQKDDLTEGAAIVIKVNNEEDQNDLACEGGLVIADISVMAFAMEKATVRQLSRAIKNNGMVPGTGLAHSEWTIEGTRTVQSCCYINTTYDFIPFGDDTDEGAYFADSHYTVIYDDTI